MANEKFGRELNCVRSWFGQGVREFYSTGGSYRSGRAGCSQGGLYQKSSETKTDIMEEPIGEKLRRERKVGSMVNDRGQVGKQGSPSGLPSF